MALKIDKPLGNTGFIGNYCRIINFKPDIPALFVEVVLGIYKSKEDRDAGASFYATEKVSLDNKAQVAALFQGQVDVNLNLYNNVASALYTAIKTLPEWSAAEDI